jgi:hypothetical protein
MTMNRIWIAAAAGVLLLATGVHAQNEEQQERRGSVLRVADDQRTVTTTTEDGTVTTTVTREDRTVRYEVREDGSIRVRETAGEETKTQEFKNAEEMRRDAPELHELYRSLPVRNMGRTPRAERDDAVPVDQELFREEDERRLRRRLRALDDLERIDAEFGDGRLTAEEHEALSRDARRRLDRDNRRLDERERTADAAELERIQRARFRASLRAIERDLLQQVSHLRASATDVRHTEQLDGWESRIRDSFRNLQRRAASDAPADWDAALDIGRRMKADYEAELAALAGHIGVDHQRPDAVRQVRAMERELLRRIDELERHAERRHADTIKGLRDRVGQLTDIRRRLERNGDDPANRLDAAERLHRQLSRDLDRWALEIGVDDGRPSPLEEIARLRRELIREARELRQLGGAAYDSALEGVEGRIRDTFGDLRLRVLNQPRALWADTLEDADRFYNHFRDTLELWEQRILGVVPAPEDEPEEAAPRQPREPMDVVERDVDLPRGEHMDVIGGVRVSRLMPLTRRQLGLEHGLSVNEILNEKGALARAGVEVHDIILKVDDKSIDTRTDLRQTLNAIEEGQEFKLTILRDGKEQQLTANK